MNTQLPLSHAHWLHRSATAALSVMLAAAGPFASRADAAPSSTTVAWRTDGLRPTDTWNTLALEMRVSRRRITKSGEATGSPSPATTYRIERSSSTGNWKTVITVLGVERAPLYSLGGALVPRSPFPVARIEDDEDGTPVRAYDAEGRQLRTSLDALGVAATASSTLPRTSGRHWLDAFVATASLKSKRLQEFERQFGKGTKAGALTRFLRKDLDSAEEVLVDPKAVVPVESKGMRGATVLSRRSFTYSPAPDAAVVRTSVHSETLVSADSGERAVVDTAFSNIRLELRR